MVSVLTNDGQVQPKKPLDLFFPSSIKPQKVEYRLVAYTRDFGHLDLTGAVVDEFYYEELESEFSQRLHATLDNTIKYKKSKYPSEFLLMPTQVELQADWGAGFQRVFIGSITGYRKEGEQKYSITAYDPMNRMLRSDSTLVLGSGSDTSDGLDYLAEKFQIPVVELTAKPHVADGLDSFIARGDRVGSIYSSLFRMHYGLTGEEWIARYNPRATASVSANPRATFEGGVEYINRSRPGIQVFSLDGYSIFDAPTEAGNIDELVTVVQIAARPVTNSHRSSIEPEDSILEEVSDKRPNNNRALFGDYIRIVYLDGSNSGRSVDALALQQKRSEAHLLLNEFGQPKVTRDFEAFDLPWLRRWDRIGVFSPPLGDVYTVESVTHDCLAGKMRISAALAIKRLLFPTEWMIPDGEVQQPPPGNDEDPPTNDPHLGAGLFWPFPGSPNVSGFDYGAPTSYGHHEGVDLYGGTAFADVHSAGDAVVIQTETRSKGQGDNPQPNGYGNFIILDHGLNEIGQQITTRYAHLSEVHVTVGATVHAGQTIGQQGNTGTTSGSGGGYHCHFETRAAGEPFNPHDWCKTWQL